MNPDLRKVLEKQHYKIVGSHSGVKTCHWLKEKLIHNRCCYKEKFYGIKSHRCLQMTPTLNNCTQNCLYCWRYQDFTEQKLKKFDEPEFILEESIDAQRLLISGFKGDERCDKKMFEEASNPNQVAISLSGEPTIYPKLAEFIEVCRKRNMTTFVVSNGTKPEMIENLKPTQLYITVAAPNREIYKKLCAPVMKDGWEKINESLEILPSLDTRTVVRHTLVDKWNIGYEDYYAKLDMKADPDFIECKAYMFVGYSRQRMNLENMPSHEKIKSFAEKLSEMTGYEIASEKKDSRVVVLAKDKSKMRI
ncbi:MAG: 4-demethylwyosine synthase TYW1 [Thermoplasmatales archaeon]|nr:4-demethylwyosine synthase TYW1 [Candidatus Thermoplasmatota archaeon]MCG2825717.1 4-demethylwyosine synthase TYW1 [Thermoplasmatales archaeon]